MKKSILLFLMFLLVGCNVNWPCYKYSDIKEEQAEVIQLSYIPDSSSSGMGVGTGMNMDGDLTVSVVPVHSYSPEVWAVVLRCKEHNKTFAIKSKPLYTKVKQGDEVTLRYVDMIKYYKEIPNSEEIIDQHTRQIIVGEETINRNK